MNFDLTPAYELLQKEDLKDVQSTGYLLKHKKSGARVVLLENEDTNKVFNIAFRTTPKNSTGVAHIMEHSVLCGSRKFPAKDPFVELAKGSMNTFLNAMTYPDKTMYPVASTNDKDFSNLVDVYLDAVLYPNIYKKQEIFCQEGWSYRLESAEDELTLNGVVYNEMKGAYSSADDVLARQIQQSLFEKNTYHNESGGDPDCIPELSYEEYLDFHRTYYHPSNSYIYFYGKMDFVEKLNRLDQEYLSAFDAKTVDSAIALQEPFTEMVRVREKYPVSEEESDESKAYLSWNAVIGTSTDTRLANSMGVLEYALLDAPGAPLKQALLDAGLGSDVMGSFDSGILQPIFSVIAKGADADREEEFLQLIQTTLEKMAEEGVDENALKAAINSMEFRFREADYGTMPKGLVYGVDLFDTWLYDESKPFDYLRAGEDFAFMKEQIGTGYYEELIRKYLLGNTHASSVTLVPDKGLAGRNEKALTEKLAAYKASLTQGQIQDLVKRTQELKAFQEAPSTQEELEKIPALTREDLEKNAREIRNKQLDMAGIPVVWHEYATNGIAYINLFFDAANVPAEDLPYLSLLRSVLGMVDTDSHSYQELFNEINMYTGGITPTVAQFPDPDENKVKLAFSMTIRTLDNMIPYSFDMVEELLFTSHLDQEKRLKEIIKRIVSRLESQLKASGSSTAALRGLSGFSDSSFISDSLSGIRFYRKMQELAQNFDEKKEELFAKLQEVLQTLRDNAGLIISFTGNETALKSCKDYIEHLGKRCQAVKLEDAAVESPLTFYEGIKLEKKDEGFATSAKVQYVAKCGNFRQLGYEYTGVMNLLRTIMSYDYLWQNLRVLGGAYGCSGSFRRSGEVTFASYRDPHLKRTIEVYEGIPKYLEEFTVSERDLTKYVIGTVSDMDTPLPPSTLGSRSFTMLQTGVTYDRIQKERDQVLTATQEDVRALANVAKAVLEQSCLCVVGSETKLKEEKDLFQSVEQL